MTTTERDMHDLDLPDEVADVIRTGRAELEADATAEQERKVAEEKAAADKQERFRRQAAALLVAGAGLPERMADLVGVPAHDRAGNYRVPVCLPGCGAIYRSVYVDSCNTMTLNAGQWEAVPAGGSIAQPFPSFARAAAVARDAKLNEIPL